MNDYMLALVASREGEIAVENIMGHSVNMDYTTTLGAIYTSPEIATVGLSEKDDILNTIHAHPTVAEAVMEAAGNVFGHGIHTPKQ